jgi:hypothetical protein
MRGYGGCAISALKESRTPEANGNLNRELGLANLTTPASSVVSETPADNMVGYSR